MSYTVDVNDAAFRAKWQAAQAQLPAVMDKTMGKAVLYFHSKIPGYPAPPTGSTYQRTGTLGRSYTTEVRHLGADIVGVIGSAVVYAPYVVDEQRQAAVHKDRWYTLIAVLRRYHGVIAKMFHAAARELLE